MFSYTYSFELLIYTRRQHDAGDNSAHQQDGGVDDPGHRGVPAVRTAATQQTASAAAQARHLVDQKVHVKLES